VPLIIGIASGSTEAAIHQAKAYEHYNPAALMTLPPATMDNGVQSFVDHYVELGHATDIPIILQQSPHIPMYSHCELPAEALAEIADQAPNVKYFKIEGPGAPAKMQQLAPLLDDDRKMFGGGGGITVLTELKNGASGLIPGVGFNEVFLDAWDKWSSGDADGAESIIQGAQQLVKAVSGQGHEYSLHVRKHLMHRAGYINSMYVRKPTVTFHEYNMSAIFDIVDALDLRISQS
jgi:4-hydroxy-tetrahydrodipicolinate synthase